MKVVRVPWIQCRADEVGAETFVWTWRGKDFELMAFNRKEAEEWWNSLSETFKSDLLGMRGSGDSEAAPMLF
jgi:hypothetical protein